MSEIIEPTRLHGPWKSGYVLGVHTLTSEFLGYDENGKPLFNTVYSDLGYLLYSHKYQGKKESTDELATIAAAFVANTWRLEADIIVPVPPTRHRNPQPLYLLGDKISIHLKVPFAPKALSLKKSIPELKQITDFTERTRLLTGAHSADAGQVGSKKVLLLDDLYRSGATMTTATKSLYAEGKASEVHALAITRTRTKR